MVGQSMVEKSVDMSDSDGDFIGEEGGNGDSDNLEKKFEDVLFEIKKKYLDPQETDEKKYTAQAVEAVRDGENFFLTGSTLRSTTAFTFFPDTPNCESVSGLIASHATGSAGTGKSFVLRHVIQALKKRHGGGVHITASTGAAAVLIGGTTIHAFAGIGDNLELLPSRPVPSFPALSCTVLPCPALPCPVLSCPVLSCPVLYRPDPLSSSLLSSPLPTCPLPFTPFSLLLRSSSLCAGSSHGKALGLGKGDPHTMVKKARKHLSVAMSFIS
eukprot:768801-Hanusia_phi.AAC.3